MRSNLGMPATHAPWQPSAAFHGLMDVENQVLGEFPEGFAASSSASRSPETIDQDDGNMPQPAIDQLSPGQGEANAAWPARTTENLLSLPELQDQMDSTTDWYGFDMSGLVSEVSWEDLQVQLRPLDELQGLFEGNCEQQVWSA